MPASLCLSQNGVYAVPGGYPFKLSQSAGYEVLGTVPKGVTSISADVYADNQANAHLCLLYAPTVVNGSDGEVVADIDSSTGLVTKTYQVDALSVGITAQTLTVQIPTTKAPALYVFRLWADNFVGVTADTVDRDGDGQTSDEAPIPGGLNVEKVYVG